MNQISIETYIDIDIFNSSFKINNFIVSFINHYYTVILLFQITTMVNII